MAPQCLFWLLLIAIIYCGNVFPTANAEKAFVRPNTNVTCPSSSQPCLTFSEYAQEVNQYFVDYTKFFFLPGTHELDAQLELENLSNISFTPYDEINTLNDTVQILLSPSANITWTNCDNVEVSGLVFILSGQYKENSAELIFQKTTSFLTNLTLIGNGTRQFAMCISSHIQISSFVAANIQAPALYAANSAVDFYGEIVFINNNISVGNTLLLKSCHCSFSRNMTLLFVNNAFKSGFGAVYFLGSSSIISGNVSFVDNTALAGGSQFRLSESTCFIRGNVSFLQNNVYAVLGFDKHACSGGVICTKNSILVISGIASFIRNRAIHVAPMESGMSGGAIGAFYQSRIVFEESSNISFIENSAALAGGAISIEDSSLTMHGRVLFERNSAGDSGGAIRVFGQNIPTKISCSGKSIVFRNNTSLGYGGAIYAMSDIYSAGTNAELRDVVFERNVAMIDGGAVYAFNTFINMTGTLYFVKNSAHRGGAMAFKGNSSKLQLIEPLTAHFVENSANMSGGAIFFDDDTSGCQLCTEDARFNNYLQDCFLELSSRVGIRLNFDNNTADIAGQILYGGNLDTCGLSVGRAHPVDEPLSIISSISNVNINVNNYKENTTSNVSSDPLQVCICKSDSPVCNTSVEIKTVRGREFTLQAVIVGQGMGAVPSAVRISLDDGVGISAAQYIQSTGKTCTNISYSLFAESNTTAVILFPDKGPCRDTGISRTLINVTFLPCPNGFIQNGSECVCEESLQDKRFKAFCNISDNSIKWTTDKFWVGALYDSDDNESTCTYKGLILCNRGCPFDNCVATPVPITLDNLDIQCNHNHTGILCGSCKENYSIAFGTLKCLPCSNNYLALILPFALAGIALVVILLLLRLTVTAGTLNGLIFYANVIQANRSILFPPGDTNILTVFIAWLNLDLGIDICFYNGMTTYAYTWLQFVFPFYVWFLIGLIIVVCRYSNKLTKIFGKNPVAALSTLLLLSYSKILRTIITVLTPTSLEYHGNIIKRVWFYDGNVPYFVGTQEANHLALAIVAILVLFLLFIPYTLLLFCAHWLQALSHWRILSWLNKIKPFMDTYHAPYKKQTRYWTGLLLSARLFIFGYSSDINNFIIITSITAVLLGLAWMHKGIYENRLNDILEALFIVNVCIFSAATYQDQKNAGGVIQARLAYSSVGLAFTTFICIVLFHIYMILRETAPWKKIPKFSNIKKYFIREKEENNDTTSDDCQKSLNMKVPVTKTVVDLREPLLEQ